MQNSVNSSAVASGQKHSFTGYAAGLAAGIAYGANPLFGKDLLTGGVPVNSILLFRYLIGLLCMGVIIACKKDSPRINWKQFEWMIILGLFYSASSMTLFEAYKYIPAGLATTVVYLYPVFTALIMVFLHQRPSWQSWVSIAASLAGVVIMTGIARGGSFDMRGIVLCAASAFSYAMYLVIVNQSRRLANVPANIITFYSLGIGAMLYLVLGIRSPEPILQGIDSAKDWLDLFGLGLIPTMVAMLALAVSTKAIGPTKTAVLGVSEPLTAIAIGTFVFAEPFTFNIAAGVAICIAAILFMVLSDSRKKAAA